MSILATKSIEQLKAEAAATGEHSLKRVLGPLNLVTLGIGAIIGTGIFVLTGQAAAGELVTELQSFPLLADEDHKVAEAYGVWKEKSMYGKKYMGVERTTFVIGADGRVKKVFEKVKVDGHAAEVLAVVG